ncbi:MAG TPA: AAA family ATPase, partial [Ktedonobacterales bacterium]|nr:AAA family ATPase [Ktedonobacterales bacterium]
MAYEDAQDQAPPMPQRSFGRLLRHYRRLVALSQEALAERAGVSMRAIGGMERDEGHTPYAATAHLLVDALGLTSVECAEFLAAARAPHGAATRLPIAQRRTMRSDAPTGNADSWESSGSLASNPPAQPLWRLPDLPLPLTPLIGRAHEVAQVCALLRDPDARLVTLCGPPGVGKTRLALQAAHSLHNEQDGRDRQGEHSADDPAISRVTSAFPDGIVFVDLAALRDPAQVIPAIAQALRIPSASGWTITERLIAILRQRRLLLLLDTCEHVLAAGAELVTLLQACPGVKALATSRAALQVRGEYELPVQPLALPGSPTNAPDEAALMELATTPAVALFISRAQTGAPAFALTRTNASAIVALCRRLDGLPLAIELAAARLTLFSPQELLARLERRLPMLTRAARDLPVRQRTLRDALTWSYDLLSPQEQAAFRHLAVFAGGATHEAAEVILQSASGRATQAAIADALAALGRQSLLSIQTLPPTKSDGQPITRIRLLDTIHE